MPDLDSVVDQRVTEGSPTSYFENVKRPDKIAAGAARQRSPRRDTVRPVPMASFFSIQHHLVLVGGGHSYADVLRVWAREPVPRVRLSVVTDSPRAVYSGMFPGLVAGQYRLEDLEIDVERLARRAGAAWFLNLLGNRFFGLLLSVLVGQHIKDTLCGTKVIWRTDYAHLAAGRAHFGDFDPYEDFDLIFGAAKLNLRIVEIPVRYHERTYGAPNIRRFADGWLLLRMSALAAGRPFFTA